MNKLIFGLIFCIITIKVASQSELGQTKQYIINKNEECFIASQSETLLILQCDAIRTKFYGFDDRTSLCWIYGFELTKDFRSTFIKMLIDDGALFVKKSTSPIILASNTGNENDISPSSIYINGDIMYSLLGYDLVGNSNSGYFGVYVEYNNYNKNESEILGEEFDSNEIILPLKRKGTVNIVSINIGGKNIDYILDSGASFCTINKNLEKYFRNIGVLRDSDYHGEVQLTLADGSSKVCKKVIIPSIKIGEKQIRNVEAVVLDTKDLLLGKSFLDQFKGWKIDNVKNLLILE